MTFSTFLSMAGVLIALSILLMFIFFRKKRLPYEAKPLLTKREYAFYRLLKKEADARDLLICPKVGLKDLMEVTIQKNYLQYFRKISQKHVDFVICDKNLRVLFAVELDDSSHDTTDAKKRDLFKDQAFKAAKIPLRRIRYFNEQAVKELFR
ncbi:MAG: DUF2726 domain-containing protein [Clostridium sp.]|jgi:hypothetical protein|nr:DUF2726 domain-containing protein [Clostridium sp.]